MSIDMRALVKNCDSQKTRTLETLLCDLRTLRRVNGRTGEFLVDLKIIERGRMVVSSIRWVFGSENVEDILRKYCEDMNTYVDNISTCRVTLNGKNYDIAKSVKVKDLPNDSEKDFPIFVIYV